MRRNNVRDFEENLLKVIHNDVEVEHELQPILTGKLRWTHRYNARPDIRGVWRPGQNAYGKSCNKRPGRL